jgi:hypothetical protein
MKALLTLIATLGIAVSLQAQTAGSQYAPEQLDQLLGPIALYPDPLIALILPASTDPSDISLAAQFLAGGGDPSQVDSQPWDPSVKGLAHYPEVLKWMNDNADWTRALGAAFSMQPADVMKSVQQLRARAVAAGTLVNTPQQAVDMEGDDIRIVPAEQDLMYVPEYDPDDVYDVPEGYEGPFLTFGVGYPVGAWLGFECDWDDFGIWVGPWHPGWAYRRDWQGHNAGSRWHPDPARGHQLVQSSFRPGGNIPSPHLIAGARAPARAAEPASRGSVTVTSSRPDYRGYGSSPAPSTPAPASPLFGGYSRGTTTRDYSERGQSSRQAPVRGSAPATRSAPERSEGPAPGGKDRH